MAVAQNPVHEARDRRRASVVVVPGVMLDMNAARDSCQKRRHPAIDERALMMKDNGAACGSLQKPGKADGETRIMASPLAAGRKSAIQRAQPWPCANKIASVALQADDADIGVGQRQIEHKRLDSAGGHSLNNVGDFGLHDCSSLAGHAATSVPVNPAPVSRILRI
jgi:hypothetical protein